MRSQLGQKCLPKSARASGKLQVGAFLDAAAVRARRNRLGPGLGTRDVPVNPMEALSIWAQSQLMASACEPCRLATARR